MRGKTLEDYESKIDKEKEKKIRVEKKPWKTPELTVLDIKETEGGTAGLFEDEAGIAS